MEDSSIKEQNFILGLWGVRYQVKVVQLSIEFYTKILGFNLDQQNLPAFGQVSIGNFKLSQRSWSFGFSTDARWPAVTAWWLESDSPQSAGLTCSYC